MFPKGDRASARSPVKPGPGRAKAGPPGSAEPVGGTWRRLGRLPQSMGWLPFTTLVLCILGLVDSAYQAYADYAGTGLLGQGRCLFSGAERSRDVGARDAGRRLRVAFYAFMVAICSPRGWRSKLPAIHRLRLAWPHPSESAISAET